MNAIDVYKRIEYLRNIAELLYQFCHLIDNAHICEMTNDQVISAVRKMFVTYEGISPQQIPAAEVVLDLLQQLELFEVQNESTSKNGKRSKKRNRQS